MLASQPSSAISDSGDTACHSQWPSPRATLRLWTEARKQDGGVRGGGLWLYRLLRPSRTRMPARSEHS